MLALALIKTLLVCQGGQHWLVRVEGVNTVEEAEELRGHVLSMSARDRPEIDDDDEFYVQELIGMQVCYTRTGIHTVPVIQNLSK